MLYYPQQECEIEMREEEKAQRKNYIMNCKVLRGNSAAGQLYLWRWKRRPRTAKGLRDLM